jgi:hypothetical protein
MSTVGQWQPCLQAQFLSIPVVYGSASFTRRTSTQCMRFVAWPCRASPTAEHVAPRTSMPRMMRWVTDATLLYVRGTMLPNAAVHKAS